MITAKEIHYAAGSREILRGVNFQVTEGEFVGLIGPNGSGKSTFLKNLYKVLRPQRGAITLCGEDLLSMSNREMAQRMAVMVQEQEAAFDFTVEEVVMMGRQARKRLLETDSREDWALVGEILDLTGLSPLRKQGFITLSGGEKQRVLIARALAQQTAVLVLDETHNMAEFVKGTAHFFAHESCGKCVPCREGTSRLDEIMADILAGGDLEKDEAMIRKLNALMSDSCFCPLGQGASNPVLSALKLFPEDFKAANEAAKKEA